MLLLVSAERSGVQHRRGTSPCVEHVSLLTCAPRVFVGHLVDCLGKSYPLCVSSGLIMSLEKELAPLIEELRQVVEVT